MGLAPILVERNFEIIKQVHDAGVAMLVVEQNANVSLSIADRGYVLSTGRLVLEGEAADLREDEDLRKAYLGRIPAPSTRPASAPHPRRVPDLRASRLPQLVLAGRAVATRVRAAYEDYLDGWDAERRASGSYWVERAEAARGAFARLVDAEPDDVAVTTSVSPGRERVRERARPRAAAEDRDQRLRVPDRRPDRARAGAARGRGRARPAEARRLDPPRALRRGDRRADGARVLHDGLYRNGTGTTSRRSPGIAHERGALVLADSYQATGAIGFDVRALGVDVVTGGRSSTCSARPGSGSCGCAASSPGAAADADRLVRRRGHLRDGHLRLLAGRRRPALPCRARRRSRRSTAASPACELIEEIGVAGDRGARARARRPADRRRRRARRHVVTPREPERRGALVCVRSTDAPRSSPRSRPRGSSPRSATATCASRRMPTTSRTTSTGCWKRCARTASYSRSHPPARYTIRVESRTPAQCAPRAPA